MVGMISDGGSGTVGTAPLVEQGAKMAVAWANAYKGGLGGHPIQLFICENLSTPGRRPGLRQPDGAEARRRR